MPVAGEIREFAVPAPKGTRLRLVFQKKIFDGERWLVLFDTNGDISPLVKEKVDEILNKLEG